MAEISDKQYRQAEELACTVATNFLEEFGTFDSKEQAKAVLGQLRGYLKRELVDDLVDELEQFDEGGE